MTTSPVAGEPGWREVLLWVSIGVFLLLALVPLFDRAPHRSAAQRRAALVIGAMVVLITIGLALLAWVTQGVEHIGGSRGV